ncbi:type II toxin-antitoxin system VapC family toxin [Chitinimonas koreensis]|uniref:type II toxin-antitoxin system VapC family toxin n=1 Tax=Chitinimonas koreensis TaxID=356302 RepID=UPI000416870E|nr:type II toxin-antitoxin system VapC family toxin [Chitinimonas koreensis]QNM98735.1 type II toxin-antitoxin system VapC family toxin [Chitinimonas koreensis]
MSGAEYLIDTNIAIGLARQDDQVMALLQPIGLRASLYAYSPISRMEALGYGALSERERAVLSDLFDNLTECSLNRAIEDGVIALRCRRKIKLPDAIIIATAWVHGLQLLTLDRQLQAFSRNGGTDDSPAEKTTE